MWLGERANPQPALPAFILGLVMSNRYVEHGKEQERMRVVVPARPPLHRIDRTKFSLLIAAVVLSAIVPTATAQRFFRPHLGNGHEPEPEPARERPVAPMPPGMGSGASDAVVTEAVVEPLERPFGLGS
jgi:hypothetical protein